ncbi:MAG TPA: DUF3099 domain-containing protein [Mycobacteriales bacterium]|mgnify:CR=1 FL=1|nr:DUF3099 domain-containing protein [Mycobacteriales bacterium]
MGNDGEQAVLVTTAAPSPAAERDARERRYLITMGIRVVAFVAAIPLARASWWLAAVAITLSLVLPWVAVISANAPKRERSRSAPSLYRGKERHQLEGRDLPS